MAVTIFGGDLRTGLIRVRNIPAQNGSCTVTLGAAGKISAGVKLPLRDPYTKAVLDLPNILVPGRSFLAWEEDGVILNGGPIWNDSYEFDSKKLSISAAGLRSYWEYRYVLPVLDDLDPEDLPPGKDTVFPSSMGLHLRTIAKRLVQQAQLWSGGSVPVVFEPDFPGDAQRTYKGHELHVVEEKLRQISEVQNGPDIMFNPRYANAARTHIEWLMETGNPEITQPGPPHKWDASGLPNPSIKAASIVRDGSATTTDNYQTGSTPDDDEVGDDETSETYPLMAKSVDPYLWGPDEYGPWSVVSQNTIPTPKPEVGLTGGWAMISGSPVDGGYRATLGTATTPYCFTGRSARTWAEGDRVTLTLRYRVDVRVGNATHMITLPHGRTGNVYYRTGQQVIRPIVVGQTEKVVIQWTVPAGGLTADQLDVAVVGCNSAGTFSTLDPTTSWFVDEPLIEPGWTNGDYYDGNTAAPSLEVMYSWDGLTNQSMSNKSTRSVVTPSRMFPRLESSEDRSSVINLPVLQSYADEATMVGRKYTETWKFAAKKDVTPRISEYTVGHQAVIVTAKDEPRVGGKENQLRIMEITSSIGNAFATLSCAPKREGSL